MVISSTSPTGEQKHIRIDEKGKGKNRGKAKDLHRIAVMEHKVKHLYSHHLTTHFHWNNKL